MKINYLPLRFEDIEPYDSDWSVVRLFKDGKWHAGVICHVILEDDGCEIFLRQSVRFSHPNKRDPLDLRGTLITEQDGPVADSLEYATAFVLKDPHVINSNRTSGILAVTSRDTQAVFSYRKKDRESVKLLLECKQRKFS